MTSNNLGRNFKRYALIFIVSYFVFFYFFSYIKNDLANNGTFTYPQLKYEIKLHPHQLFWENTSVLMGNRLHFGRAGWDFSELFTTKEFEYDEVSFDLYLGDEVNFYFYFFLSSDDFANKKGALRFSCFTAKDAIYKSAHLNIDRQYHFESKDLIDFNLVCNSWNKIKISRRETELNVIVNGMTSPLVLKSNFGSTRLGFFAGMGKSILDNFEIKKNGHILLLEKFNYRFKFVDYLLVLSLSFIFVLALAFLTNLKIKSSDRHYWEILYALVIFAPIAIFLLVGQRFDLNFNWLDRFLKVKDGTESVDMSKEVVFSKVKNAPESEIRIALVGTSQTFGVGSDKLSTTIDAQLSRIIFRKLKRSTSAISFAIPGAYASVLYENYGQLMAEYRPQLLIINLSGNDNFKSPLIANNFKIYLEKFVELGRSIGAKVIFIEEAVYFSRGTSNYLDWKTIVSAYQTMEDVAAANGVLVIPMSKLLYESGVYDKGIIWADGIHFTTFGQEEFSELLSPYVVNVFK